MAKSAVQTKQRQAPPVQEEIQEQRLPAVQESQLPAELMDEMSQHEGLGVSTDQADNLVPLIYLLQSNSPQCQRGHEKFIEGAAAGDIWLRANEEGQQIIDGREGLQFQPCFFSKDWVEWQPNRGGFVARHAERPPAAQLRDVRGDDGNVRQRWLMPGGNIVVETRYHVGFALAPDGRALPYTIPFSSTGHTVSKGWMFSMNSQSLPNGKKAPMCAVVYRLVPKLMRKGPNTWFQYTVHRDRWTSLDEWRRGLELHQAFASGAKQIAEENEMSEDEVVQMSPTQGGGGHDQGDPGYQGEEI